MWRWDITTNSTSMILVVTFVFPAVFRGLFYPEPGTRIKCWRLMFLPNTDTFKYVQFVTDFTAGTSQYQIFTTTLWLKQVSLKTNHDLFQIGTLFFLCFNQTRALAQCCHDKDRFNMSLVLQKCTFILPIGMANHVQWDKPLLIPCRRNPIWHSSKKCANNTIQ